MIETGQQFPAVNGRDADGNDVVVGDLVRGSWGVVLFYRGHW